MEISATNSGPSVPVRPNELNGRLAALRALQRSIEEAQDKFERPPASEEGKGLHLDLRC